MDCKKLCKLLSTFTCRGPLSMLSPSPGLRSPFLGLRRREQRTHLGLSVLASVFNHPWGTSVLFPQTWVSRYHGLDFVDQETGTYSRPHHGRRELALKFLWNLKALEPAPSGPQAVLPHRNCGSVHIFVLAVPPLSSQPCFLPEMRAFINLA